MLVYSQAIGLIGRVFANGSGDWGSILGPVIPKTQKMVFDSALLKAHHEKARVMWSNPGKGVTSPLHLGVVAVKKGACGSPSTKVANFILL